MQWLIRIVFGDGVLAAVAERPPMQGELDGLLPARVREFGHVVYTDRSGDYDNISHGRMDAGIYPTAMFIKRPSP